MARVSEHRIRDSERTPVSCGDVEPIAHERLLTAASAFVFAGLCVGEVTRVAVDQKRTDRRALAVDRGKKETMLRMLRVERGSPIAFVAFERGLFAEAAVKVDPFEDGVVDRLVDDDGFVRRL